MPSYVKASLFAVTVTGFANYDCNFYGFSRTVGEDDKAELVFGDYTGTVSGEITGFREITLAGDTAMTFADTADVANTAWIFDATERTDASTVFATGAAVDFGGNSTIKLNLGEEMIRSDWSIFAGGAGTTYGHFDVLVDGVSILSETIGLDEAIVGGAYAGWGFTIEEDTLKFKHLA